MEQRERIEAACARDSLELVDVLGEENVSGRTALERRPGLSRAVAMVESGEARVLVVAYFDRLVRSLAVQRELLERVEAAGGAILAVDVGEVRADTASRWLSSTMLGMVAEYHRRVTAERTADAKRRAVERGVAPFPKLPPYLKRGKDGELVVDRKKARVVREAAEMRADGATIDDVRAFLAKRGIRRSYHGTQALLTSRMLLGELRFGDLVNERAFAPPIVDVETFKRIQRVTVPRGRRAKSERLLARLGVLCCGTCGARMVVGTSQGRYPFYRCPPVGDCPDRATISAEKAEPAVAEAVQAALKGIEEGASVESGVNEAADELARRQDAYNAALRVFDGHDEQAARERLAELREARDQARERHDELLAASVPAITVSAGDWNDLSLDGQRALIRAVVERAVVSPGRGHDRMSVELRGE